MKSTVFHMTVTEQELVREILKLHRAHKRRRGTKARKSNVNNDLVRRGLSHPDTIKEKHELGLLPSK